MKPIRCEIPKKISKVSRHTSKNSSSKQLTASPRGPILVRERQHIYTQRSIHRARSNAAAGCCSTFPPLSLSLLPCCSSSVASASLTNLNSPDLQFKGLSGPYSARLPILIKSAPRSHRTKEPITLIKIVPISREITGIIVDLGWHGDCTKNFTRRDAWYGNFASHKA